MCDENGPCSNVADYRERIQKVHRAVSVAASGDLHGGSHLLTEALGDNSVHGLICMFGMAGVTELYYKQTIGELPKDGFFGFEGVVDMTTGETISDPPEDLLFAGRFGIAYSNGDAQTCMALYKAACLKSPEHIATCIATMFKLAAGQMRELWSRGVIVA